MDDCGNRIRKQQRTIFKVFAIFVLVLAIVPFTLMLLCRVPPHAEFDPAAWRDTSKVQQGCRLEMADLLIEQGTLYGKTRTDVIAILGEPPNSGYFKEWDLVYRLGNERGVFSIDSEWLVVRLDAKRRVAEYRILRD